MAADGNELVSLRPKPNKRSRGSIFVMSRRRISCKDLGNADCQGWMYKKKEKGAFLGNKWKKYWSVLKGSCLYWYTNQMAEKAEGFINLPDFIVNPAIECKKKHAIKISHPQIKSFYFAAGNGEEMNKWLNKLGLAVINRPPNEKEEEEDCWSESEHDDLDIPAQTPPSSFSAQQQCDDSMICFGTQSLQQSSSVVSTELSMSLQESSRSQNSGLAISMIEYHEKQSRLHTMNSSSAPETHGLSLAVTVRDIYHRTEIHMVKSEDTVTWKDSVVHPIVHTTVLKTQVIEHGKNSDDEMERLYKSLEQASLSPIGDRRPSSRNELRKSFIKRCKNPSINDKLHKIRTLNSTLKCKEHDLAMINQLLEDCEPTAQKYREWKDINTMLFQDIYSQPPFHGCTAASTEVSGTSQPSSSIESDS
ncbi:interactor protein for cytohesin exchange factors 1 isoform X2 [Ascaphus truei]|uniref:interactor protein for cytohesin exchange factors 1 isoform X2 n=1 Tax=Ascaphus truei TaxID=8439 RepID=UPI003F5AB875